MNPLLDRIANYLDAFSAFMWGPPLVILLVGGGLFFVVYSRARPYRYFFHAIGLVSGKYNDQQAPGDVPHSQSLATALSGTIGLGNLSGVAIAIATGGPGAIFWMWVTALVGVATKFYTASLAVMYRGQDSNGDLQGGPMYVIREGLHRHWHWLAVLFSLAGLIGTLPVFQANQFVELLRTSVAMPMGWASEHHHIAFDGIASFIIMVLAALVIMGKIKRIGQLTVRLVPAMVVLYFVMTAIVLAHYASAIPSALWLIIHSAFTGSAATGGALGSVIMIGVSRGAFSNEAGVGTESMAHGAAQTHHPIREGIVAMTGPVIDTLVVCTCTALVILLSGTWHEGDEKGITLTVNAFSSVFPVMGPYLLLIMVGLLSFSTIVTFWFYGAKCLGYLLGAHRQHYFTPFYLILIVLGSVVSLKAVNGLLVGMYAVMAIPTMISTLLLAPRVNDAAKRYFSQLR